MSQTRTIALADVEIRPDKSGFVADVRNGEDYVDEQVDASAQRKKADASWETSKGTLRKLAEQVSEIAESVGRPVDRVNLLGSKDGFVEVQRSRTRKALPETALLLATDIQETLIQEETEITLKGPLAAWVLTALGDRSGKDANFVLKRRAVLLPEFDERLRVARKGATAQLNALLKLRDLGINAPAVEAKIRRG